MNQHANELHSKEHISKPVCGSAGAQVAVKCSANGKTRTIWAKGSTDGYGEFLIELPSHLHAIHDLEKICLVKVFHLPKNSACRQGKREKLELKSTGDGMRTYMTHDIQLMSKLSKAHIYEGPKQDEIVNYLQHNGVRN
ncbi:uncharacterized protein LOC111380594 [Olea europaea var. sylvestris]|uniref:uncharacterized protein LOC111380594 n=1 Tax=Olea europaea var. sylvestris TaxID=158386 RepID=UPI000C1D2E9C|nr:uncharacterized protein LOC111380594 [Olea europaea var. sylvestris]